MQSYLLYIFPMGLIHGPCFYCDNKRYAIKPINPPNKITIILFCLYSCSKKSLIYFQNSFVWTNHLIIQFIIFLVFLWYAHTNYILIIQLQKLKCSFCSSDFYINNCFSMLHLHDSLESVEESHSTHIFSAIYANNCLII